MEPRDIKENDIDALLKFIKIQVKGGVYDMQMLDDLSSFLTTREAADEFERRYEEEIVPLLREKK